MSSRRRYRASNFGTRISRSSGLLGSSVLTSSFLNREPSDYSSLKLVNHRTVTSDVSIYNRSKIYSFDAKEKSYQNKHFSLESESYDDVKETPQGELPSENKPFPSNDLSSKTMSVALPESNPVNNVPVPDVNPLTEMEIKSAAQWRAVSGRVSWNLKNPERVEKHTRTKRARARQRVPTKPRDRNR